MRSFKSLMLLAALLSARFLAPAQPASFTGAPLTFNFDSMGLTGTTTPTGWSVASNAGTAIYLTTAVTPSTGGTAVSGAIRGFNLGTGADRALGVGPTGSDRYIVLQITNKTAFGLDSFTINYRGEQWRTGADTTTGSKLELLLSYNGSAFTNLGADFEFRQSVSSPATTALDGNANFENNIGGLFTPSIPLPPGGTLYLLWYDFNDSGTDPVLAIDDVVFSASTTNLAITMSINSLTNGQTVVATSPVSMLLDTAGSISNIAFYLDGVFLITDFATPFGVTIPGSYFSLGSHTLTAIATNAFGQAAVTNSVTITVVPNQPPALVVTNIFSGSFTGSTFLVGSPIVIQAAATDDLGVSNVTWLVDGSIYVSNRTIAPYTFTFINPLAGVHTIRGVVQDVAGLLATSAVVTVTVTNPGPQSELIITNGAEWKYYFTFNEPPPDASFMNWTETDYDDFTWGTGHGELGGGDGADYPEKTVLDVGPTGNRYLTAYFRKHFFTLEPDAYANLVISLLRDDGAVVHLNGRPVWTNNIPNAATTPLSYSLLAAGANDDGTNYQVFNLLFPTNLLVLGDNVVAVEVHQANATSSDLSFDLMLWGERQIQSSVAITTPTNNQTVVAGLSVTVNISATTFITNVALYMDNILIGLDGASPFSWVLSNLTVGTHRLVAVGYDQVSQSVTSAPVTLQILPDQPPALAFTNNFSLTATGATFLVGSTITNQLGVTDDRGVTNVDYYVDGAFYWRVTNAPFGQFVIADLLAGMHTLTAVAADVIGQTNHTSMVLTVTNPPLALLVTNGANWQYLASTNTGLGAGWTQLSFNDGGWSNGLADLGNDSNLDWRMRTLIDIGPTGARYPTVYFRHIFQVSDPAAFDRLVLNLMADDGAVVYLNGTQVTAYNFATNTVFPVTYTTLAQNIADNGSVYHPTNLSPAALVRGTNIIAVEVHQTTATSSDLVFDLMLWGESSQPRLAPALAGGTFSLAWPDSFSAYSLYYSDAVAVPAASWTLIPGPYPTNSGRYEVTLPATNRARFFNLRQ